MRHRVFQEGAAMQERRTVSRRRTFLKGFLAFNNGNSSKDCLVRDLTESGALIELPHPDAPASFVLLIPSKSLRASARVAWRVGGRFGLNFARAE
jgi:hypothetical protein